MATRAASRTLGREDKLLRNFFLGFAKVHVLHHASHQPIYGEWFLEELARTGRYHLSPGTVYPLFHDLESMGYLRQDRVEEGTARRYYAITPEGERALGEVRDRIRELVDDIMEGECSGSRSGPASTRARCG